MNIVNFGKPSTRRAFIKKTSAMAATAAMPYTGLQDKNFPSRDIPFMSGADFKVLSQVGLEAVKDAGAEYAEVFFSAEHKENWGLWIRTEYSQPEEDFTIGVGVRTLYNGYWGFAGFDGVATSDVMARLGRDSVAQAKNGARGKPRNVDLAPRPIVQNGSWSTPIEIDPFTQVSRDEKIDFISAMNDYMLRVKPVGVGLVYAAPIFTREERVFASSDGSFTMQTLYTTSSSWNVVVEEHFMNESRGGRFADFLSPAGAGWEYLRSAPYQDKADEMIECAMRSRYGKPMDVGRYEVVFDAYTMAHILDATIGTATELDRAFGYEANGVGTSFLNEPLDMLGTFRVGSDIVNIGANRSMKGGAATVKWDAEGVEPNDVQLVTDGVVTDFQTTRESASWLKPYYDKLNKPVRSSGCAGRDRASLPTTHWAPNIVMQSSKDNTTFDDLVASVKKGFAVIGGNATSDQQALNGSGRPRIVYEIRDGKLGDVILQSGYLYRAPEFWKNVVGIGGRKTVANFGLERSRDYRYRYQHTVTAVPAKVAGVAMIDTKRKA